MNIKSKRFVIVMLTLVFAVSVFAVTAFASGVTGTITPGTEVGTPGTGIDTPDSGTSSAGSGTVSTGSGTVSTGSGTVSTDSGAASTGSGAASTGSGTASSKTTASSRAQTTSSKYQAPVTSLDTQENQVEATASQAAAAVSDPDVLSSENWSELLSSGEETQSQAAAIAGASTVSSTAPKAGVGGVSMILILGVVLIVLALCGFGLFVYLQFFTNRGGPSGRGGQGKTKGSPKSTGAASQDTITFTDISSDSDGEVHRGDYVPNNTKAQSKPQPPKNMPVNPVNSKVLKPQSPRKAPVADKDVTAPIPPLVQPERGSSVASQGKEPPMSAQATPVTKDSNFDWENFFNDQN